MFALVMMVSAAGRSWEKATPQSIPSSPKSLSISLAEPQHIWARLRRFDRSSRENESNLSLSPMQFAAENIKELLPILLSHELNPMLGQFQFHAIAALNRNTHLSIHRQEPVFLPHGKCDGDARTLF